MKKKFIKPTCEVYELTTRIQLLTSSSDEYDWGDEGGYIPGIPGQSDDKNQKA